MTPEQAKINAQRNALRAQYNKAMDEAGEFYKRIQALDKEFEAACEHNIVDVDWRGMTGTTCTICNYGTVD